MRAWPAKAGARGCRRIVVAAAVAILAPGLSLADATANDFQFDPVAFWAARILAVALITGVALAGYALLRALRGRLGGPGGKTLLLVAVVVIPWFSVATGMLLVFSRAVRVSFCGSCHRALGPYVDDMTNPHSSSLAALHYAHQYIPANQCYECHSSYGLFGSVKAKIEGMKEVVRYYTGTFEPPLAMFQPYRNADCLKCHARSRSWLGQEAHVGGTMKSDLFADAVSCLTCHEPAHAITATVASEGP